MGGKAVKRMYGRGIKVILICLVIWATLYFPATAASLYISYTVSPPNGTVTVDHRPLIRWNLSVPASPEVVRLYLDNIVVDGYWDKAAKILTYQPIADLTEGKHQLRCEILFLDYQPIKLETTFQILPPRNQSVLSAGPVDELRKIALATLNQFRQSLGVALFRENRELTLAAQGHGDYISQNYPQVVTLNIHREQSNFPGFIGQDIGDRAAYFGYFGRVGEALDPGGAFTPQNGVNGLIDSPYHRLLLLNPNFQEAGIGFGRKGQNNTILVIASGTQGEAADEQIMMYPYEGQRNAKIGWFASEVPNPLRFWGVENQVIGYPISLSVHGEKIREFRTDKASLTDELGAAVPVYQVNSTMEEAKKHLFLLPKQPLDFDKTYQVKASGQLIYQDGTSKLWQKQWSFHTVPALEIATIAIEQSSFEEGRPLELLRLGLTCGDLPDLTYELSSAGKWVQRWDSRTRKFQFYELVLPEGQYDLTIKGQGQSRHFSIGIYQANGIKNVTVQD